MKKTLSLVVVFALCIVFLSACGTSSNTQGSSTENQSSATTVQQTTETTAKLEPVTLTWFNHYDEDAMKQWMDISTQDFTKANPNVTFDISGVSMDNYYTLLKSKLAAGDAPDIFDVDLDANPGFVDNGYVMDLTGQPFLDNLISPAPSKGGKTYILAQGLNFFACFYNKDAFQKAGITAAPTTWTEFKAAVDKLKTAGITPIASGYKDGWTLNCAVHADKLESIAPDNESWTQNLKARTVTFSDDKVGFKGVLERAAYIYDNSQKDPFGTTWDRAQEMVATGEAGMLINGSWAPSGIETKNTAANLGTFPFPWSDDASKNSFAVSGSAKDPANERYGSGLVLYAKTQHKDEALKFFAYLSSPENGKIYQDNAKQLCNIKGSTMDFDKTFDEFAQAVTDNKILNYGAFQADFGGEFDTVFYNEITKYLMSKDRNGDDCLKKLDAAFDNAAKKAQ